MNTPVTVAVLTGAVTAVGWLVNHALTSSREREIRRTEATLKYVETQLEYLYGPLAFLIYEGRQAWNDLLQTLGRDLQVENRPADDEMVQTWLFWAENLFMPRNEQIVSLLMTKTHLVDGPVFPTSYIRFVNHHNSWKMKHSRWKADGVEYSWHSNVNWPQDFDRDVIETFEQLKRRHSELIGRLSTGNPAPTPFPETPANHT